MQIPVSRPLSINGFRSLCSFFLFLVALGGGALCQIRSKLRISTRDHIFEYEFRKNSVLISNKKYTIKWSIIDRAFPYQAGSRSCDLCSAERIHIAMGRRGFHRLPEKCKLLNKRKEIFAKCRHILSHTLSRVKDEEENG